MLSLCAAVCCLACGDAPAEALPRPTFYCTYDDSSLPDFAAGSRDVGLAARDAILYEAERQWAATPRSDLPTGKVGGAWLFERGGKTYPVQGNLDPLHGTLMMWVQPQWEGSRTDLYASFFGCQNWGLVYKYQTQDYLTFGWIKDDGKFTYGATADVKDWQPGEWHHLALVWDATEAKMRWTYLDGKLAGQQEIPSYRECAPLFTVGSSYGGVNPAQSLIDEVAIFGQSLTALEVANAYQRGRAGQPLFAGLDNRSVAPRITPPAPGARPPLPDFVDWSLPGGPPVREWRRANAYTGRRATETRERISLNGAWRLRSADSDWCYVRVPGSWTAPEYFTVKNQSGEAVSALGEVELRSVRQAWYERTFDLPDGWQEPRIVLGLDSVRAIGEVFLNGQHLGRALEYERAEFDISDRVRPGTNWLQIRVESLSDKAEMRGLDEDVWIERRPKGPNLEWVHLHPLVTEGALEVVASVTGTAADVAVQCRIRELRGKEVARGDAALAEGVTTFRVATPDLKPWHPDAPALYLAEVSLVSGDKTLDALYPIRFGYRQMEIREGDFLLNGKTFHLRGQSSPPFGNLHFNCVEESIREWMGQMRAVHVNAVREYARNWASGKGCQWRELYYDLADERGLLILSHLPSNRALVGDFGREPVPELYRRRLADFVHRYGNHACTAMWFLNFNTGAHEGDIRPDLLDGSFNPRSLPEKRQWHDWMDFSEETLKGIDDSRPVFHHAAGDYGQVLTVMAYLGFGIPLQEREEWPSAWARKRHKPLMPVETGFPCLLSNYRERDGGLDKVYASEQLTPEYFAAYVGDRVYENLTEEEVRLLNPGPGDRMNAMKRSANYDEQKALFGKWTMRSWRTWGLSYCQHVEWRDCFTYRPWEVKLKPRDPRHFGPQLERESVTIQRRRGFSRLGKVALADNAPVLAYIAGPQKDFVAKDRACFVGGNVAKSVVLINDSAKPVTFGGEVALQINGEEHPVHTFRQRLDLGETRFLAFRVVAPELEEPTSARLVLRVSADKEDLPADEVDLRFFPRPEVHAPARPVHILDTAGHTTKMLTKLGIETQEGLGSEDSLLVIGRESLPDARDAIRAANLRERIRGGMNVLVFEQTGDHLAGMPMDDPNCRNAFIQAPDHPILADLTDADLSHWRGQSDLTEPYPPTPRDDLSWGEEFTRWSNRSVVCSFAPEKPQRGAFRVLVAADFDLYLAPLLEWRLGAGKVLFCQLDVTSRIGRDPVATLLVLRMLEYLGEKRIADLNRSAILAGDSRDHAPAEGPAAEIEAGGATARAEPDARAKERAPLAQPQESARTVLIGTADNRLGELFPDASVKQREVFKVSVPPELRRRGIHPSDFFWREAKTVPVLTNLPEDALATDPPLVVIRPYDQGEVAWIGVAPQDFDDCRQRAKVLRLVNVLTNAEGPSPDLAAAEAMVGGEQSVYAARQMDFNPYRYRRW